MPKIKEIKLINMERPMGGKLIHAEHHTEKGHNASGGEEVLLEFDNGAEILIYVSDDGILWVEGD